MRNACKEVVLDLMRQDKRVMLLTADGQDVLSSLPKGCEKQFVDYGIAESNMIASAAGLAACGKQPFLFAVTNFMAMRGFEFIRDMVCIPKHPVVFLGFFSGLTRGSWGATHHGTEDFAILRTLPNLLVISPATPIEAREATRFAYEHDGPVYIRIEGRGEPEYFGEDFRFRPGEGHVLHAGDDVTIVAMGSIVGEAIDVANACAKEGIGVRVIEMPTVQPVDDALIPAAARETRGIISLEEHSRYGGLGGAIAECLADHGSGARLLRLGLDGCAKGCGGRQEMREQNGIGKQALREAIRSILTRKEEGYGERRP